MKTLTLLLCAMVLMGCATTPPAAPGEGFSGHWTGSFSRGPASGPIELVATQTGTAVSGTGWVQNTRLTFTGTATGPRIHGTVHTQALGVPWPFEVVVDGDQASGSLGQGQVTLKRTGR